jgi:hypothetical protein
MNLRPFPSAFQFHCLCHWHDRLFPALALPTMPWVNFHYYMSNVIIVAHCARLPRSRHLDKASCRRALRTVV